MPKKREGFVSKTTQMKRADFGFPQVMNKSEACFYLWRNLNLSRLQYLIDHGKIRVSAEDGREIITKRELDNYTSDLYKKVV